MEIRADPQKTILRNIRKQARDMDALLDLMRFVMQRTHTDMALDLYRAADDIDTAWRNKDVQQARKEAKRIAKIAEWFEENLGRQDDILAKERKVAARLKELVEQVEK